MGYTDFLPLRPVRSALSNIRDPQPHSILAEVRNTEQAQEKVNTVGNTAQLSFFGLKLLKSFNFLPPYSKNQKGRQHYHEEKHSLSVSTHSSRISEPPHQCIDLRTAQNTLYWGQIYDIPQHTWPETAPLWGENLGEKACNHTMTTWQYN